MIFLFVFLVLVFAGWVSYFINKDSQGIHNTLEDFRKRASNSKTIEELEKAKEELIEYAKVACWHRVFGAHAREVMAYIKGREMAYDKQTTIHSDKG